MDLIYKDIVKKKDDAIFAEIQSSSGVDLDREELIRALQYDRDQYDKGYDDAMASIVRCKDCVHRKEKVCCNPSAGMWVGCELKDDDFCSYGERREGE